MRTVPQIKPGAPHAAIDRKRIYAAMTGIFLVNILLRCFYARYQFINGDEAVRALTALRMLEGGRLYVDVVTDKPPGASLFYLAVLAVFKHNMAAVHFAAILWNFGTAAILYRIGARFYSRSTGLWAALLFVLFSANYFPQDAMAANTELLLVLPYSLSFYCWLRSSAWDDPKSDHPVGERGQRAAVGWLFMAGLFTG
ncbi:MAG TPA: glycosyltransferase family 39 protein, partial [Blastocatellia bacterium]|nr:glycosyltransferase family 39 protein [Blastocatellia bacterium]